MNLFFKKKACCCSNTVETVSTANSRIKVLGKCCSKSVKMFENTKQAVVNLGLNETISNIGDFVEIAKYNVLQTPALVVDEKVLSYGKLLDVAEIERLIKENIS